MSLKRFQLPSPAALMGDDAVSKHLIDDQSDDEDSQDSRQEMEQVLCRLP